MIERDELAAWLRLLESPGLGLETARRLLAAAGSPQQVFDRPATAWRTLLNARQLESLQQPPAQLDVLLATTEAWLRADPSHQILVLGDPDYPDALLQTADPPLLLYLQGRRELLAKTPALAIVGSRSPTPQGRDNAEAFARALSQAGLTIVSGLAVGIDGAAHQGALAAGGDTIAVVGTGLDQVYPRRHQALAQQIAAQGLVVGEYALGTPALAPNFPRRNRIIAGLAQGCLVVEAALQSGSLITARLASEAGREVFAIPGSIHSPQSRGCHALLRQGAKLVETAADVLDELPSRRPVTSAAEPAGLSVPGGEPQRLLELMGFDPVSLDALQARSGFNAAELNARLLDLELAGAVARLPGQLFQRRADA
jgi:DNA processing protein